MTLADLENPTIRKPEHRFSGHQTFALRIAWLPKAVEAIAADPNLLNNTLQSVTRLGLGKNMVEALRCWLEAYGVATKGTNGWALTNEAALILNRPHGFDPFLEDPQTLWWLHWKISTLRVAPFFAWDLMINRWNEPSFSASAVVESFARHAEQDDRVLSEVTMKQHFEVWLRTYCAPKGGRALEDGLDSPLAGLALVRQFGERETAGRREHVYGFDLGRKRGVSQALFHYCLIDWWDARPDDEQTAPFHEVAHGSRSPGRVLRMPEGEVRERLHLLGAIQTSGFELHESLSQQQLRRTDSPLPDRLGALTAAYARGASLRSSSHD
ncbi:hypothetical protein KOAAANKH_00699 [Brevundimonas sp. NIBR10]|uniref:DUF4007 family protein n=1 Tax=Brevundimonas sp. NIBR10 TaxID=3015997 RepID=UPI0022F1C325|nr:DUF4007 family protein [Brevundimonas sp. NIBR10]WGM45835.1 hypothetical protein KOAAANKH_00699 [Brevundimonas sp. NIBR10]